MYNTIFFDLDGTITDPGVGITNSVMYALKKYGITVEDRTTLYSFIGPPLVDSFQTYFDFTPEQAADAVALYRKHYIEDKAMFENEVYPGIPELLANLKKNGKKVVMATSKPTVLAEQILKHFGLWDYFDFVSGSNMDNTRGSKEEVIRYALEQSGVTSGDSIVMIGDRKYDILGAKTYHLDSIGVLYGYGSKEELEEAGADYIVADVTELEKIILKTS